MDYLSIEVKDRQSFAEFLELLLDDFNENKDKWENNRLNLFLEAMHRYTLAIGGYYKNIGSDLDADVPSWRVFADILCGSVVYE